MKVIFTPCKAGGVPTESVVSALRANHTPTAPVSLLFLCGYPRETKACTFTITSTQMLIAVPLANAKEPDQAPTALPSFPSWQVSSELHVAFC